MDVKDAVDELVPSHLKPINQAACLTAARQFTSEEACSDSGIGGDQAPTVAAEGGLQRASWSSWTSKL